MLAMSSVQYTRINTCNSRSFNFIHIAFERIHIEYLQMKLHDIAISIVVRSFILKYDPFIVRYARCAQQNEALTQDHGGVLCDICLCREFEHHLGGKW